MIVYFLDCVQIKSILLTHILYCLLSWLGSDKIDTLDTHTLLVTFLTGFRQNRYSWHTYFIVYFLDWVQIQSIFLTHILYCLLSWLGSDKIDPLDTHTLLFLFYLNPVRKVNNKVCVSRVSILSEPTLLFTFLTVSRQNRYSWHTYFFFYFLDWVQTNSILLTHTLLFTFLTVFRQNRYSCVKSIDFVWTQSRK
jgi:hypothetical protein